MTEVKYGVYDIKQECLVDGPFESIINAEVTRDVLKQTRPSPKRFKVVRWEV